MAIVAMVPEGILGAAVPPGVSVGVAEAARRTIHLAQPVASRTGRPTSITPTAPGTVQLGRPMPTTAARARIQTTKVATAQTARERTSRLLGERRVDSDDVVDTAP